MPDLVVVGGTLEDGALSSTHVDLDGFWESCTFTLHDAFELVLDTTWCDELDTQPCGEVWLIRSGICSISQGEIEGRAEAGDVIVLRPGRPRRSSNGGDDPVSKAGFDFSVQLFESLDLLARIDLPLVLHQPPERLTRSIEDVTRAAQADPIERAFHARSVAESVFAQILHMCHVELAGPSLEIRVEVRHALDVIAERYRESLDVATIARAAHLSPQHLTRRFRESLGTTPMSYLRVYRLQKARELIFTSDVPIKKIARDIGFRDPAHFSRAFKQEFGISPRDLRGVSESRATG